MDVNTCLQSAAEGRTLALFSHLIPAVTFLILGFFAYRYSVQRHKAAIFFAFTIACALWLLGDLVLWSSNNYYVIAAAWAPLDYIEMVFFALLMLFLYADQESSHPFDRRALVVQATLVALLIPLYITLAGQAVGDFNLPVCEMSSNSFLSQYKLVFEVVTFIIVLLLGVREVRMSWHDVHLVRRAIFVSGSVAFFMAVFSAAEYYSSTTGIYELESYTFFGLPLFILALTFAITRLETFTLGNAGHQLLFLVFLLISGTQFFFTSDLLQFGLASIGFLTIVILGVLLFKTLQREEQISDELAAANAQQKNLLHFISHEIKGYLTKGQNAFAGIVEGDYGPVSPQVQDLSKGALEQMRRGVSTVMDILDASNLKKGTISFDKKSFDMQQAVTEIANELGNVARDKGLQFDLVCEPGSYLFTGDETKLRRHVFRNLIDNSIRYTPSGSIRVKLLEKNQSIVFSVSDTGVGISPDDMPRLFTEGGHGKDSIKVNVDSTGYGLFVAKQVVDAHNGTIFVRSEGPGKGATFVVQFPITS